MSLYLLAVHGGERRARISMLGKEETGHHDGGQEIKEEKLAGEGG